MSLQPSDFKRFWFSINHVKFKLRDRDFRYLTGKWFGVVQGYHPLDAMQTGICNRHDLGRTHCIHLF